MSVRQAPHEYVRPTWTWRQCPPWWFSLCSGQSQIFLQVLPAILHVFPHPARHKIVSKPFVRWTVGNTYSGLLGKSVIRFQCPVNHTHLCRHTHTHTHIHSRTHTHTHTQAHTYTHIHTQTHTQTHTQAHTYTHRHTHPHTLSYTHTHIHPPYTHSHIYTHTHCKTSRQTGLC